LMFGRIASLLTEHRVFWKKRDRSARAGYRLQTWSYHRCERAYHSMLRILAEESRKAESADSTAQPSPPTSVAVD